MVVAVAVDAEICANGNTFGHMAFRPILEENSKHQCRDTNWKPRWRIVWVVVLEEFTHDGVGSWVINYIIIILIQNSL